MKRILLVGFLAVGLAGLLFVGKYQAYILEAPAMMTGMGAKLSCSGKYVTGLSEEQAKEDLVSYSPILSLLTIDFDDVAQQVRADLMGFKATTAQYRPSLGCSLLSQGKAFKELEIVPVRESESLWPKGEVVNSISNELQNLLDEVLYQDNERGLNTRALLVVKDGEIVAESYAEGFNRRSQLLGWSMAKSVTSILIGMEEYQGTLKLSDNQLFDSWQSDERRDISLENMLTMTSGLDFSEDYNPGQDATRMLFTSPSASDYAMKSLSAHEPGSYWSYSSGTTNLLSRFVHDLWVERYTEHPAQIIMDRFFKPLGMANSTFELDASGVFVGSSYLYASARDWARVGQLMISLGSLNQQRLITPAWVQQSISPNSSSNDSRYGYQFWLNGVGADQRWPNLPEDSYAALGNRKQVVMMIPSKQVVIVRLGWTQGSYPTNDNFAQILKAVH